MIDIFTVGGKKFDLGEARISIELNNPLFSDTGSYSYPFTLPDTPNNNLLAGFPGRLSRKSNVISTIDVLVYISGMFWSKAKLEIRSVSSGSLTGSLMLLNGALNNSMKNTMLHTIDMGGSFNPASDPYTPGSNLPDFLMGLVSKNYPDVNFACFPVKNEDFYKDHSFAGTYSSIKTVNLYTKADKFYILNNTFVYYPYVNYILKQFFKSLGYSITDNFLYSDPDWRQLVLHSLKGQCAYSAGGVLGVNLSVNLADQLPHRTVADLVKAVCNTAGVAFFPYKNSIKIVSLNQILEAVDYIDFGQNTHALPEIELDNPSGFRLAFSADSDDTYWKEQVKEVEFQQYLGYKDRKSSLPMPGLAKNDIYLAEEENDLFIWNYNGVYGWNVYGRPTCQMVEGAGEYEIKPPASVLPNERWLQTPSRGWMTPVCKQKGANYAMYDTVNNQNESLRFMFYRGMCYDGNGDLYPMGGTDRLDYLNFVRGARKLQWHGAYGLYNLSFKNWINWYLNIKRKAIFTKNMLPAELLNLDFSKKHRINQENYLISRVVADIGDKNIIVSKIDCYKT